MVRVRCSICRLTRGSPNDSEVKNLNRVKLRDHRSIDLAVFSSQRTYGYQFNKGEPTFVATSRQIAKENPVRNTRSLLPIE
jgi:hypothetical protein